MQNINHAKKHSASSGIACKLVAYAQPGVRIFAFALPSLGVFGLSKINGLIDVNCDGVVKIVFTGDSITRGIRDDNITRRTGGYVQNLEKFFPEVQLINLGVPGKTSLGLLQAFQQNLPAKGKTYRALKGADYLQLEIGTNDYFKSRTQIEVVRFITSLRDYLRKFSKKNYGSEPFIFVASLPPTTRPYQKPFIRSVNSYLLSSTNQKRLQVLTRFDQLPSTILSYDDLHPDSEGYKVMAKLVRDTLLKDVQTKVARYAVDTDKDGIADLFERKKFMTDPANPDTDGDGILDGTEVFGDKVQLP